MKMLPSDATKPRGENAPGMTSGPQRIAPVPPSKRQALRSVEDCPVWKVLCTTASPFPASHIDEPYVFCDGSGGKSEIQPTVPERPSTRRRKNVFWLPVSATASTTALPSPPTAPATNRVESDPSRS